MALFLSELIGTAWLVLVGLSLVILMFGTSDHDRLFRSKIRAEARAGIEAEGR
jgi:hypothetical protein